MLYDFMAHNNRFVLGDLLIFLVAFIAPPMGMLLAANSWHERNRYALACLAFSLLGVAAWIAGPYIVPPAFSPYPRRYLP